MSKRPPKILFLVTEDWAFLSHRLPMARAAQAAGAEVIVATRISHHADTIKNAGFKLVETRMDRGNRNPFSELLTVVSLMILFWRIRPDILHNVGLKPLIDGTFAALFSPVGHIVNMFTGMGAIFVNADEQRMLRRLIILMLRLLMRRKKVTVVVQNPDDANLLVSLGVSKPFQHCLIYGSGISVENYPVTPENRGPVTVTMVSRLLWDKGVGDFVEAARQIAAIDPDVRFVVVGGADPENPRNIDDRTLASWRELGVVDFVGPKTDIAEIWATSHIAVLPSYREGMPKSMLEAASCGRPLIVTDVPGCRELVREGENGLLVPARDPVALAFAITMLAHDPQLRSKMGSRARKDVEERFSDQVIEAETKALYTGILGRLYPENVSGTL
ncbi:MAG: glycosyltransferase family 4 protein [Rhodospirillales bacterium]|nr:glycosyltransferase family 4 protein [Rhodospirillales bacterium]